MLKINGKKMEILMAEQGLTVTNLCENGEFNPNTIVKARRGEMLNPKTVGRIASVLKVSVTDLIAGEV